MMAVVLIVIGDSMFTDHLISSFCAVPYDDGVTD